MNNDKSAKLLLVISMPKSLSASKLHSISNYKLSRRKVTSKLPMVVFVKILQNSGSLSRTQESIQRHFRLIRISQKSQKIRACVISEILHFWCTTSTYLCLSSIYKGFPTINGEGKKHTWKVVWSFLQKFYKIQRAVPGLKNSFRDTLDS